MASVFDLLLVLLTDDRPFNELQNQCGDDTISALLHSQGVHTAVVGIEGGGVFDQAPFERRFYPYAPEVSFMGVESVHALLGDQMHPVLKVAAFPMRCDVKVS